MLVGDDVVGTLDGRAVQTQAGHVGAEVGEEDVGLLVGAEETGELLGVLVGNDVGAIVGESVETTATGRFNTLSNVVDVPEVPLPSPFPPSLPTHLTLPEASAMQVWANPIATSVIPVNPLEKSVGLLINNVVGVDVARWLNALFP